MPSARLKQASLAFGFNEETSRFQIFSRWRLLPVPVTSIARHDFRAPAMLAADVRRASPALAIALPRVLGNMSALVKAEAYHQLDHHHFADARRLRRNRFRDSTSSRRGRSKCCRRRHQTDVSSNAVGQLGESAPQKTICRLFRYKRLVAFAPSAREHLSPVASATRACFAARQAS